MEKSSISQIMFYTLYEALRQSNLEGSSSPEQLSTTFSEQKNFHSLRGLKLILGPTGIGKTNGIKDVMKFLKAVVHFYIANRKNLLRQMAKDLEEAGIPYVWIKKDMDLLAEQTEDLSTFKNIYTHPVIVASGLSTSVDDIELEVNRFRTYLSKIEQLSSEKEMITYFEEKATKSMEKILGYFRQQVKNAYKAWEEIKENEEEDIVEISIYQDFVENPIITGLFPYLKIRNENAPENVVLTTIHKGFYGIFDGTRTIQLTEIEDALMFLDEFDFLENNLTDMITSELDIKNPLTMVDYFYHNHLSKDIDFDEFGEKIAKQLYKKVIGDLPDKYLPKRLKTESQIEKYKKDLEEYNLKQLQKKANGQPLDKHLPRRLKTEEQIKKYETELREYKEKLWEKAIIPRVEALNKVVSYEFPQIKEFILLPESQISFLEEEEEDIGNKSRENNPFIFSTAYSVSVCPLFLRKTSNTNNVHREFEIVAEQFTGSTNLSAYHLFQQVTWIARGIMGLLKNIFLEDATAFRTLTEHYLEETNYNEVILKSSYQRRGVANKTSIETPETNDKTIYEKWSQRNTVNVQDNLDKEGDSIQNLSTSVQGPLAGLSDSIYQRGFALYEIKHRKQAGKPNSVKFQYFSMRNTPEYFITQLASNNLVFGISATANMERLMNHFDLSYFREQLGEKFYEQSLHSVDIPILSHLIDKKAQIRDNDVTLHRSCASPKLKDKIERKILKVAKELSKDGEPFEKQFSNPSKGNGGQHLLNRARRFFHLLDEAVESYKNNPELGQKDTKLVFYYSFKQVRALLREKAIVNFFKIKKKDLNPQAQDGYKEFFPYYKLSYKRDKEYLQDFIILFFDAKKANVELANEITAKNFEGLFWKNLPVIVVTTYASMANGVNLQFFPTEKAKKDQIAYENKRTQDPALPPRTYKEDFRCLHLLDIPHHFFTIDKNRDDLNAQVKKNIWYLTKLRHGEVCGSNQVSDSRLFSYLKALRTEGHIINNYYKNTDDFVIQNNALFFQAMGRIERVWNKMPDQHIWLYSDVYNLLQAYRFRYSEEYKAMEFFLSGNLSKVMAQIEDQTEKSLRDAIKRQELKLGTRQSEGKENIKILLGEILAFQNKKLSEVEALSKDDRIDYRWLKIRRHLLRHDMKSSLLRDLSLTFATNYFDKDILYIRDVGYSVQPPDKKDELGVKPWDINKIYEPIYLIPILQKYFQKKGYPLSFKGKSGSIKLLPTPYAVQALLVGVIGEESTKAVFNHFKIWSSDNFNHQLFEVVDLQLKSLPVYIDAKNWRPATMHQLNLKSDDRWWNRDLSKMERKAIEKYHKINGVVEQNKHTKLVYVNLLCSKGRFIEYFKLNETQQKLDVISTGSIEERFVQAQVIFIPGMFFWDQESTKAFFHYDFLEFLKALVKFSEDHGYLEDVHLSEIKKVLEDEMLPNPKP